MNDSGTSSSWRWMRSARGATSFSPNSRTAARTCSCSSSSGQSLRPRVAAQWRADRAEHRLVARARAARARVAAGKARSSSRVAEPEIVERRLEPRDQAAREIGDRARRRSTSAMPPRPRRSSTASTQLRAPRAPAVAA